MEAVVGSDDREGFDCMRSGWVVVVVSCGCGGWGGGGLDFVCLFGKILRQSIISQDPK